MAFIPRHIDSEIRDILASSRAGAVLGPRQAGKSTLARELQRDGVVPHYYNLDEEANWRAASSDPDGFVADIEKPAVIDEVQRAPGLLLAIKQAVDTSDARGCSLESHRGSAESRMDAPPMPSALSVAGTQTPASAPIGNVVASSTHMCGPSSAVTWQQSEMCGSTPRRSLSS